MRVISGKWGGRRITPPANMPHTRPTTDIAREGLFNILQNRMDFEGIKTLEPYFVSNYLELAKAYKDNRQPAQAIEVLNKLVKLPTRSTDDVALKAEGSKLLESMQ
jgi:16S rRNA G966 N2-methylase RsmD